MPVSFDHQTRRGTSSQGASVAASVAALFLVAACGGGTAGSDQGSAASAGTDAEAAAHTHEGDGNAHTHGQGTHTHAPADTLAAEVPLGAEREGAWSGSVTLLSVGDSVRVLVTVEGMPAGSRHQVELVADGCDEPGAPLIELTPLAAGTSGAGSSQTAFAASRLEGHAHGALRVLDSDGGAAACAPIHLTASGHRHDG